MFDFPDLGRQFRRLFLAILVLDTLWATSPLLLYEQLGLGLALACVAALAYLPFSQRTLLYSAYVPTGGRTSTIRAPGSLSHVQLARC